MKINLKNIILVILAGILFGICILCFIYAKLGSDSITVFEEGISKTFNIPVGTAVNLYNIGVIGLSLLISRKNIGWASIVSALIVGFFVNVLEPLIKPILLLSESIAFRSILFVIGLLLCAIGCALLIYLKVGMTPLDALSEGVASLLKIEYKYGRIILDALLLISGYLMGGIIGVGSVISMALTGPLISVVLNILNKNG